MAKRRIFWQIYPSYLLIIALALLAVFGYASSTFHDFHYDRTAAILQDEARLARHPLEAALRSGSEGQVNRLCRQLGGEINTRLTVILPNGRVIGDSEEDPGHMNNHGDRPEIREALAGRAGVSLRHSPTLDKNMMYAAVPLWGEDGVIGAVRTSLALNTLEETLRSLYRQIILALAVIALAAALLGLLVSRRISRPLEEMRLGAESFARGNLKNRLIAADSVEIASLAEAMNRMAAQLDEKIQTVVRQRDEFEKVLASMAEGVIVVDMEERVVDLNRSAATLFKVNSAEARGRSIQEVIRNTNLQTLIAKTLESRQTTEGDVLLEDEPKRFLQGHGTVLKNAVGKPAGALVVLNDVTRLKQLEAIRKEFVANVSHELKTPITSIKGFTETLLAEEGLTETAARFLEIIKRHAERLHAIIEDLLSLSKIEQTEEDEVQLESENLRRVLISAAAACERIAVEKRIAVELACPENLELRMNAPLLEQAVVNLIENAVKYSENEKTVAVTARQNEDEILILVKDEGCGIPEEDLPRIFERFYRVDKARSRNAGGTGLGLSIVKHIAQLHGGRVSVESAFGRGSLFTIHLPRY